MGTSRQNARLRAAEKRIARQRAQLLRGTGESPARPTWPQRLDASIDPAIAMAACAMLGWLLHQWL